MRHRESEIGLTPDELAKIHKRRERRRLWDRIRGDAKLAKWIRNRSNRRDNRGRGGMLVYGGA